MTSIEKETKTSVTIDRVARDVATIAVKSIVSLRVAPEKQLINAQT
jgi:hypothetical protein